jgi:mandelate racemase
MSAIAAQLKAICSGLKYGTRVIPYYSQSARARRPRADATPPPDRRWGGRRIAAGAHRREHRHGVVGHSMVFTYTPAALKLTAGLIQNFETLVKGEPLAPIEIEQKLAKRFRLLGTQGLVGIALSAIDMALWDALARSHGTSLVRLLGGIEKPIPAYGAVGYDGVEGSAKVAEDWAKRGFSGIKAKIGYPTVREDVAVVRAMRKAVGDSVAIMVDYNRSLTPSEAVQRLRALDDEGLTWVEEPTLAHDYAGHALIARAAKTPIQCGENWWGPLDMQHAIDA